MRYKITLQHILHVIDQQHAVLVKSGTEQLQLGVTERTRLTYRFMLPHTLADFNIKWGLCCSRIVLHDWGIQRSAKDDRTSRFH